MTEDRDVWIRFDASAQPGLPRKITPLRWVHEPYLIEALCYRSNTVKEFRQRKILEVRSEEWSVSVPEDATNEHEE